MDNNTLWYRQSADLFEEALPLGNGHMGMMVYGRIRDELLELNHDTLWSGYHNENQNKVAYNHLEKARELINKGEYLGAQQLIEHEMQGEYSESYLPLGNIRMQLRYDGFLRKEGYKRSLDLTDATTYIEYKIDGFKYTRRAFISNPDKIGVYKMEAEAEFDMQLGMDSKLLHKTICKNDSAILMTGRAPERVDPSHRTYNESPIAYSLEDENVALEFGAYTRVITDGSTYRTGGGLSITGATKVLIVTATETTYCGFSAELEEIDKVVAVLRERVNKAIVKGYDALYNDHKDDYQKLYNKVEFTLETEDKSYSPTDVRLENLRAGKSDLSLIPLYFNYGRYLLITSSRKGSQSATLQGIWNYEVRPSWCSNYTSNINIQMNYWLAENCNLSECHEPLINMIKELSITGAVTAKEQYGCGGWTGSHNIDLWRKSTVIDGMARYAYWQMSGPWLVSHLYEHYLFTQDIEFLKSVYPTMKGSAKFCYDWLQEDESGYYVTSPSTSPENAFLTEGGAECSVAKASTMDMTIIREVFNTCISVAKILGVTGAFENQLATRLPKLYPYNIGAKGQLQEWYLDFEESEMGHRHVSHLYGLYPGNAINDETPELFTAAKRSLELRLLNGGGHTGWSLAWIINLYARLKEPTLAGKYLNDMLTKSIYPNMFDAHPPFQIDGNFGATAGIAEMLMQSHMDYIELLPALPLEWSSGCIKGLKARGNLIVDIEWENNQLIEYRIQGAEGPIKIKFNGESRIEVQRCNIKW
ncbi:MAG: glycoside hydrolase N-terminal domain-containing protein [Spirochaetaceae bacterium]